MGHHQFYIWIVGSGCCHTYDDQEAALGHEDLPINMVFLVIMLFVTEYDYKGIEQNFSHQATCFPELLHVGIENKKNVQSNQGLSTISPRTSGRLSGSPTWGTMSLTSLEVVLNKFKIHAHFFAALVY